MILVEKCSENIDEKKWNKWLWKKYVVLMWFHENVDFIKMKFDSDDDLPLNKALNLHNMTIIIRSVFNEDGTFYPQIYLGDCLYYL